MNLYFISLEDTGEKLSLNIVASSTKEALDLLFEEVELKETVELILTKSDQILLIQEPSQK